MKKILFVFDLELGKPWKDGLWAALNILKKDYEITFWNISESVMTDFNGYDLVLGWGAFFSKVDKTVRAIAKDSKKGLCIAGNSTPPFVEAFEYDVLFYETEWQKENELEGIPNTFHAFGINTDIYKLPEKPVEKFWNYLGVGSFSSWKRWEKMAQKPGNKLVVGHYQMENTHESDVIALFCLGSKIMVSNEVEPEKLAQIYHMSKWLYLPCNLKGGGGERALLEARACGTGVLVEDDNPKLQQLLEAPIWDQYYYAEQLKKGINTVI